MAMDKIMKSFYEHYRIMGGIGIGLLYMLARDKETKAFIENFAIDKDTVQKSKEIESMIEKHRLDSLYDGMDLTFR